MSPMWRTDAHGPSKNKISAAWAMQCIVLTHTQAELKLLWQTITNTWNESVASRAQAGLWREAGGVSLNHSNVSLPGDGEVLRVLVTYRTPLKLFTISLKSSLQSLKVSFTCYQMVSPKYFPQKMQILLGLCFFQSMTSYFQSIMMIKIIILTYLNLFAVALVYTHHF